MALTVEQQKQFRNWMIKSVSVPVLSVLCVLLYWSWEEGFTRFPIQRDVEFHLLAALCLLFGGFPLWNVILEKKKGPLIIYHGIHLLACFAVFVPTIFFGRNLMITAPAEFCLIMGSWCLAKAALGLLMPQTEKRIEDLVNWRRDTLDTMMEAHYYTGSEKKGDNQNAESMDR